LITQISFKEPLCYADRNSITHFKENRLLFLSHELLELVHSLHDSFVGKSGLNLYLLSDSSRGLLHKGICWQDEKTGCELPQWRWLIDSEKIDILSQKIIKHEVKEKKSIVYRNSNGCYMLTDCFL